MNSSRRWLSYDWFKLVILLILLALLLFIPRTPTTSSPAFET